MRYTFNLQITYTFRKKCFGCCCFCCYYRIFKSCTKHTWKWLCVSVVRINNFLFVPDIIGETKKKFETKKNLYDFSKKKSFYSTIFTIISNITCNDCDHIKFNIFTVKIVNKSKAPTKISVFFSMCFNWVCFFSRYHACRRCYFHRA